MEFIIKSILSSCLGLFGVLFLMGSKDSLHAKSGYDATKLTDQFELESRVLSLSSASEDRESSVLQKSSGRVQAIFRGRIYGDQGQRNVYLLCKRSKENTTLTTGYFLVKMTDEDFFAYAPGVGDQIVVEQNDMAPAIPHHGKYAIYFSPSRLYFVN